MEVVVFSQAFLEMKKKERLKIQGLKSVQLVRKNE